MAAEMKVQSFLEESWKTYCEITPDARRVHDLLLERGEEVVNDHVAYRTFNLPGISRLELGRIFEAWGYVRKDDMDFTEKRLKATYWLHPDRSLPKIFISELLLEQMSAPLREWVGDITRGVTGSRTVSAGFFLEKTWDSPHYSEYQRFLSESEYAAWTSTFGVRVNHFTVMVNRLKTFRNLPELNTFLKANGLTLNQAGGEIKGSEKEKLEQSSTVAREIPWRFAAGETRPVMSCYYEFAYRHPIQPGGELFQGFIPKSADKIFESTFVNRK